MQVGGQAQEVVGQVVVGVLGQLVLGEPFGQAVDRSR
jgi:hypothetical protein